MVKEYYRPGTLDEALELLAVPGSLALAGGTFALAFEKRDKPERVVDIGRAVPRSIDRRGRDLPGARRVAGGARGDTGRR